MPKIKTKRAAAKRLKKTGTGKIVRKSAKLRHILTSKSPKQKRRLRKSNLVDPSNMKATKKLIPYL